jgi:hypothetical protein
MLPVGTEVYYNNMYGHVRFVCEKYMTICVKEFPTEPVRDVCLIVYPDRYDKVELVRGNHSHEL